MIEDAKRSIAFLCPVCRKPVIVERTVFQLAAAGSRLPCPCGQSAVEVALLGDQVRLTVPCLFCEEEHTVTCSTAAFLQEKTLAFSCAHSGLDCCYVGEQEAVFAAMRRLEETVDVLESEAGAQGMFLNDLVMEEILEELRDIGRRDGISCTCGSRAWNLKINYSSVELTCARCGAHLGHVFTGERFTDKNTRHCVNSLSLDFVPAAEPSDRTSSEAAATTETAIFAGGCFWGVEYLLEQQPGVLSVEAGYTGGRTDRPTYEEVCSHTTGHAEAVRVTFDTSKVSYETLARLFFEIHDPTQIDRQGPDIGDQYRSEIFYTSPEQRAVAERLIALLRSKGYRVATRVTPAGPFWPAETCHQDYYRRRGTLPYCHAYTRRF